MVKKGFPSFGITQCGSLVADLKNYNLPDFILTLVANDCNSDLLERGRIDDRLSSMNDAALELLHKVFVDCEEDEVGKYAQYRFFAYVSSMYHKCEVVISETIPGKSGKNHKIPIAVKLNGMYIAVGFNGIGELWICCAWFESRTYDRQNGDRVGYINGARHRQDFGRRLSSS